MLVEAYKIVHWSSGYGTRLMLKRLWVLILAADTGWAFFTLVCCNICIVGLKRPKMNEKEAEDGPLKKQPKRLLFQSNLSGQIKTYLLKVGYHWPHVHLLAFISNKFTELKLKTPVGLVKKSLLQLGRCSSKLMSVGVSSETLHLF